MKEQKRKLFVVAMILMVGLLFSSNVWGQDHHRPAEKKGILLVTFGSSFPQAQAAFEHIDKRVREAFPGIAVRWAYTSHMIRKKMAKAGEKLNSPAGALAEMAEDGFTHVAVQSLHTIPGDEYHDLLSVAKSFEQMAEGISHVSVGLPLLASQADLASAAEAMLRVLPEKRSPGEAVVYVGHGSHHPANAVYAALMWQLQLTDENIFIGTVEGYPLIDVIIDRVEKKGIKSAWLMPLMSVAGDHAQNDIAGSEPDSWKSRFEAAGIQCSAVLKGTAEYDVFVDIWLNHLKNAMADW